MIGCPPGQDGRGWHLGNGSADVGGAGSEAVLHDLRERVKELTALHGAARLVQDDERPVAEVLREVAALLPPAWQYPEIACGRVCFGALVAATDGFAAAPWCQVAEFRTASGTTGQIEVVYRELRPDQAEGPFLAEERNLIDSLAEMLRLALERREAREALRLANDELERRVVERTTELRSVNLVLQAEVAERARRNAQIVRYQERLRSLAAELALAEEAERRVIAADLHDHIGQALAILKLKLDEVRRNATFCGFDASLDEMRTLLERTIRTTRTLTVEISPPVLYELGLCPALGWLAEQFESSHGLPVEVECGDGVAGTDEVIQVTVFKAVREFLINTVKHARAGRAWVAVVARAGELVVVYRDDGVGFDPAMVEGTGQRPDGFGLFSVRERCEYLGGRLELASTPGCGVTFEMVVPRSIAARKERSRAGSYRPRR